ncbi:pentatricopeptide repeat-containing protein At1g19720 isoform X1 [Apium graveolens]|uniref:pentatricopeptide repeat-containing protein At1g19720 isoform X1 n=1 Tax=Apium graveolens TaxID=4045 RepID=UPI003D79DED1
MQTLTLPIKSIPIPKHDTFSEFPLKPNKHTVTYSNAYNSVALTDSHLNNLCLNGHLKEAIDAIHSISQSGFKVKSRTFTRLIHSCIDCNSIELGRKLYRSLHLLGDVDPFIETKLVGMFAKCGCIDDARKVFDKMRERDLFTWSSMIGGFSREKRWGEVLELFCEMMEEGIVPDEFLFVKILHACGNFGDLRTTKVIHSIVVKCGMDLDVRFNNTMLAAYGKCGELGCLKRYFGNMEGKDLVSWNSAISGYCRNGEIEEAHRLFEMMYDEGFQPGLVTWNTMISTYNQLGKCDVALEMMKEMKSLDIIPDIFTWTSMVSGFAKSNGISKALELFRDMLLERVEPNGITLASAISACASLTDINKGMELHCIAIKVGYAGSVLVGNSLVGMYSKCDKLEAAEEVFEKITGKDVYTYNSMIGGYIQAGYCGKAHDLFTRMRDSGVQPNVVTWNVMIAGYIQNEDEDQAMDLFHKMEKDGSIKRDTATWNALISGHVQNGNKNKALSIFRQMQSSCVGPNSVTILSILPACADVISAKIVKEIHSFILRRNLQSELSVANYFIDTYAKSGNLVYSKTIFDEIPTKDIISWNTIMAGAVLHGYSNDALYLFDLMKKEGVEPNRGTFVSILSAYGLAKMVDEGERAFSSMIHDFNILPGLDHCKAMINLYGRSGKLEEALKFIDDMIMQPDYSIWNTLLTACRNHGNARLALHAGERLLKLDPGNALVQRLVLQIYALLGINDGYIKIKKPRIRTETKDAIGQSCVEVRNTVHCFVIGDKHQPNADALLSWTKGVAREVKRSHTQKMLCCGEEDDEKVGGVHSEKLSLAFSLLSSAQTCQPIRILKNLRMCEDCHATIKYVSKAYEREIYVCDSNCLHHFIGGSCSCGDYW